MRTVRRILVAVKDPHARILPAVEKAAQLARAFDAQLELFHALSSPIFLDVEGLGNSSLAEIEETRRGRLQQRLETLASRIRKHGVSVSTVTEWDFPAYEAIVRRAQRSKADLIVAECHPGEHRAPWLLRLTDWELLRYSPVPVLLVKGKRPYRNPVVLAAVDPSHAFAKPAKLDDEILQVAGSIKAALRGTLHTAHAYVPLPTDAKPAELLDPEATSILETRARAAARQRLEPLARKANIPPARRHLLGQHPINAIPLLARDLSASIVVMGAVSRSGLKRLFIGNTAERMLDALTCDVLVVKPPGFANRLRSTARGTRLVTAPVPPLI